MSGGVRATELVPGTRYRIDFHDCCIAGNFTAIYVGPVWADDRTYLAGHEFDTAYIEGGFVAKEAGPDD